jgi:copper chaperone NosL
MMPVRAVLLSGLLPALLIACGSRTASTRTAVPVEIDRSTTCSLDGMLVADYRGPKAQLFIAGEKQPMFFCDTIELFNTLLVGERAIHVDSVYVQDMGHADWEEPRGHWFDARQGYFVVGSKRQGSMGATIASFAEEAAARRFAGEFGGKVLRFNEVTPESVDLSGGALHDQRM